MMRIIIFMVIGTIAGGLMGYFGQCTSGACPLTSNPLRGAALGAVLGLLVASTQGHRAGQEPLKISEHMIQVSDLSGLQALIASAEVPVLVDFYADWCGPCKRLAPELSAVADAWHGHAIVVKVNVDRQPEIAASYRISSIPDLRVFAGGQQRQAVTGYRSREALASMLLAAGGVPPEGT